jgi:competence protein ComEA
MKLLSLLLVGFSLSFGAVDINKADKQELMSIKGVGKAKADAIVEYRNKNNCFKNIEQIKEVKGFGGKFLENNKGKIVASECKRKS